MIGNVFGAWTWIVIAGVTLATVAVGVPLAVITILALVEKAGSWTLGRIRRRSPRRSGALRPQRDIEEVVARDEIAVR